MKRPIALVVSLMVAMCGPAFAYCPGQVDADEAQRSISAFKCAALAIWGKSIGITEQTRLFSIGVTAGRAYLAALSGSKTDPMSMSNKFLNDGTMEFAMTGFYDMPADFILGMAWKHQIDLAGDKFANGGADFEFARTNCKYVN